MHKVNGLVPCAVSALSGTAIMARANASSTCSPRTGVFERGSQRWRLSMSGMSEDVEEMTIDMTEIVASLADHLVEMQCGLSHADAEAIVLWHLTPGLEAWLEDPPS